MKYQKISDINKSSHTITSDNTLCCGETGRVIAVFYNDYDLSYFMEYQSVINKLLGLAQEKNKERTELMRNSDQACIDIYMSIHVSVIRRESEQVIRAWYIGQDLYSKLRGEG